MSHPTWRRRTGISAAVIAVLGTVAAVPLARAAAAGPSCAGPPTGDVKKVRNTNDSGAGSLRAAISKVNNPSLNFDTIEFALKGTGAHLISPLTPLPALTAPVVIDGYSQNGSAPATDQDPATLTIVISNASGVIGPGLELDTCDSTVTGLVINNSSEHGLVVTGDGNTVTGSYFGTKHAGEFGAGNVGDGILVNGDNNTIGGGLPADRNLLSANRENGIHVQSGTSTLIAGNYIGTDAAGLAAMGNADAGILDEGLSTVIFDNVLSGNETNGLVLAGQGLASVTLNQVGVVTDAGATLPLGNGEDGIVIAGGGNFVGDDGAGNTVAANGGNGIRVLGSSNTVAANFVGIDSAGTQALGNGKDGIFVTGIANLIGGDDRTLGNVASDNAWDGIHVFIKTHGPGNDTVENNLVGTDPAGVDPRPNTRDGIHIEASENPVLENLVQFNGQNGIEVYGDENQITGNTVWNNTLRGVEILDGTNNPIVGNSIDQNGRLGIDLFPLGVTANDFMDADAGANDLMNIPAVRSATESGGNTFVTWRIRNGLPNAQFQLEFFASDACDGSGNGEAATPLGTQLVLTDANGNRDGATPPLGPASPGQVVTATATLVGPTSLLGTSELSNCATIP